MKYRFNREKFIKNASKSIKERIKYILDDIENLEVNFIENNRDGILILELYGVEHELYPVKKEWCIETDV